MPHTSRKDGSCICDDRVSAESYEDYEFVLKIRSYGKREKVLPSLVRSLCQGLHLLFGKRWQLLDMEGNEFVYDAHKSEGGSFTIRKFGSSDVSWEED